MGNEDRRHIDAKMEAHIEKEEACMTEMKDEIGKISGALFGEDGIATWAKIHIDAEKERKELFKELKKKVIVRGGVFAFSGMAYLMYLGLKQYMYWE